MSEISKDAIGNIVRQEVRKIVPMECLICKKPSAYLVTTEYGELGAWSYSRNHIDETYVCEEHVKQMAWKGNPH